MHIISRYRGNRPTNTQTNPQTGPITIHQYAKLSAHCKYQEADERGKCGIDDSLIFSGSVRAAGLKT